MSKRNIHTNPNHTHNETCVRETNTPTPNHTHDKICVRETYTLIPTTHTIRHV